MEIKELNINPFDSFSKGLTLVSAGKEGCFNSMTIGWGGVGTLWSKPVVTVYVKPCRYTSEFLKANDTFTVSFFSEEYRDDLKIMGTKSGRDCDKLALTKLTPKFIEGGVIFEEAEYSIVLKKIYTSQFIPEALPADVKEKYYADEAEHLVFIGEVQEIINK